MDPYPATVLRDASLADLRASFDERVAKAESVSISGRIMAIRGQGAILFVVLDDGTDTFQTVFKKDSLDEKLFSLFVDGIDIGDFISVSGTCFTTERGEKSLMVSSWMLAAKTLLPLPEKWHGITDPDERFRKRYLDLLMTPELRDTFRKRALFWEVIRDILIREGFLEVETPTLEVTTGGAEARPFKTHHNDFDMDVFLRISVGELWQKKLLAAGFPKTFEIGRVYRNEGSSPDHLQEFTNVEFYWAYANYTMGMELIEKMFAEIATRVFGTTSFSARGYTFDLAGTWPRIDYREEVLKQTGIDILEASETEMKEKLTELGVVYEGDNKERLTDTLWKYCRKNISGPVFLINHPKLVSPLSKASPENPLLTERFQVIIAGSELANGFSELNDPIDQRERFDLQQKLIERGDEEAMMPDYEFVEMLEHGMPPACGFGFGERLFSFLVDKPIRETTLFPLMRPKATEEKNKKATMIAVAVLNKGANLLPWQELNTVAHLNAALGARVGKNELFTKDIITSKDNVTIKLNPKIAIMLKTVQSSEEIFNLSQKAKKAGLEVQDFIREMIETTNDKKIIESIAAKNVVDVEYLGVLIYGDKKSVDEFVKDLPLYS